MVRGKKIISFFIVVILLVSCSSRKSFGTSYLAGNSSLGDSLSIHEELEEYLSYADDYKRDFILHQKQKRTSDSLNAVDSTKTKPKLIETLDTTVVSDTMITEVEVSGAVESNNDSLKNQRSIYMDTVAMINQETDSSIIISSEMADGLTSNKAILKDSLISKREYPDSLVKKNTIVPEDGPMEEKKMDNTTINSTKKAEESQNGEQEKLQQTDSQQSQQGNVREQSRNRGRGNDGGNKIRPIIIINNKRAEPKTLQDTTIGQPQYEPDTVSKDEGKQTQDHLQKQLEKKSDESNSATITPSAKNADSLANLFNNKELKIENYDREKAALIESNEKLRKQTKLTNEKWDTLRYSIFFDSGQQKLSESNKVILKTLIQDAKGQNYMLQLSGHTDKSGSADFNKTLSENRVKSVFNYIVANGLDEKKIFYQAFGANYATSENDVNRRIVSCKLIFVIDN